jgi:hypothetical protein
MAEGRIVAVEVPALTKNRSGLWVPAIPLPYFLRWGRVQCECGRIFSKEELYRGHYALVHVMELD